MGFGVDDFEGYATFPGEPFLPVPEGCAFALPGFLLSFVELTVIILIGLVFVLFNFFSLTLTGELVLLTADR